MPKVEERHRFLAAQLKERAQCLLDGKICVGVISNKEKFDKLKANPLYGKFYLKHLQSKRDTLCFGFDLVIKIKNPGMIDEGASDAVREMGLMIWNQAALYEWAKKLED